MSTKQIKIIEMGGTIASVADSPSAEFYQGPKKSICSLLDGISLKNTEVTTEAFTQKMSQDVTIEDLLQLGKKLQDLLDKTEVDGVVICTGTNALEDIAYCMGLIVNTTKPIVFTGSYFPQNSLSFDGTRNLFNALVIASSKDAHQLGVLVTFNGFVISARDATKNYPGLMGNFSCDGVGIIGHVVGEEFVLRFIPKYKHTYTSIFSNQHTDLPKISIVYAHLGMGDLLVRASISAQVSGIVSAGFGKGYQPTDVTIALRDALELGIAVVRCTRNNHGCTNIDALHDNAYGFVVSHGLSAHKASLLLSLGLSVSKDRLWLQQVFEEY